MKPLERDLHILRHIASYCEQIFGNNLRRPQRVCVRGRRFFTGAVDMKYLHKGFQMLRQRGQPRFNGLYQNVLLPQNGFAGFRNAAGVLLFLKVRF